MSNGNGDTGEETGTPSWYMPGSVLSALWGSVMPRLAATVWKKDLPWPPEDVEPQLIAGDLKAYPLLDDALEIFWEKLAEVAFAEFDDGYADERDDLRAKGALRYGNGHRSAHVVLEYFDPEWDSGDEHAPHPDQRLRVRIIRAHGYDFILNSDGLDVFIPDNPFEESDDQGRKDVLRMYKYRETGRRPIALPKVPASWHAEEGGEFLIPIPQLTAPTGAYQVHDQWAKGRGGDVQWWITGSVYRGIMAALPRIIASKWYEEVVWGNQSLTGYDDLQITDSYRSRWVKGDAEKLKGLLQERMETPIPATMAVQILDYDEEPWKTYKDLPGWNERDVMITDQGLYFPDPGDAPNPDDLLDAIESGVAGNPVFTDSGGD